MEKVKDKILRRIIDERLQIPMEGTWFYIEDGIGKCKGCYFLNQAFCPSRALRFCGGDGNIIFRLVEPWCE